jgi:hypothetical protein
MLILTGWITANDHTGLSNERFPLPLSVYWYFIGGMVGVSAGFFALLEHSMELQKRIGLLEQQDQGKAAKLEQD